MSGLILRPACEQDTARIVEIYNSNPAFLTAHLGRKSVDAAFLLQDHAAAESAGFLCCVLETDGGRIAGVMDYRPGRTAYLSLLMLDKAHQGQGLGTACCRLFEERMRREGCKPCASTWWAAMTAAPLASGRRRDTGPKGKRTLCGVQSAPAQAF